MELLKKLLKDGDKVVGLCAFRKEEKRRNFSNFTFSGQKLVFYTNTRNNFLLGT